MARLPLPDQQPFTPRLSGAGSLRRELEALLAVAPPGADRRTFRRLTLEANAAGKGSASMRAWAWKRLSLRYLLDPALPEFRTFEAAMRGTESPTERGLICFLMLSRTDRLFREVTLELVSPKIPSPGALIDPAEVEDAVREIRQRRRSPWSDQTVAGERSHLLSALKDFGVLCGAREKRTCCPAPGAATAVFAAHLARLEGLPDRQVLGSRWFRLLGLAEAAVVDLLYAATRERALDFRIQADVVELSLPEVASA